MNFMNKISNILWGLVFIGIGVIIGINTLGIAHINIFFDGWWTLFIIVPSFIDLFKDHNKTGDFILLVIGIVLLLACQDIIRFDLVWKLLAPAILIIIGLSFIFKDFLTNKTKQEIKKLNKNNEKEYAATFSEQNLDFAEEEFTGCNLNSVFGSTKCDLRKSKIKEDVIINASSIFGGITIFLPEDYNVKITSTSIFGGVSDERGTKTKGNKYTIYINATCLFGGVEIK